MSCKLCEYSSAEEQGIGPLNQMWDVKCKRCGHYLITDQAFGFSILPNIQKKLYIISAYTRLLFESGANPLEITSKMLSDEEEFNRSISVYAPQSVKDKTNVFLQYIQKKSKYPGDSISLDKELDYPIAFCQNEDEFIYYIQHLINRKLLSSVDIDYHSSDMEIKLTINGWEYLSKLSMPISESTQAFVAMWFDEEVNHIFDEAIIPLEKETGFKMVRIDKKQFNEKICDKILADIRNSRFIIADVTGHRQGVYFEAGFAMGLGLPVIWCCREDQLGKNFDTRQYNHIIWKTSKELHEKLRERILATIGKNSIGRKS